MTSTLGTVRGARSRIGVIPALAFVVLGVAAAAVLLGESFARFGATTPIPDARLQPPSLSHPLGTDNFSRDVLDRIMVGARASIVIGLAVAVLSSAVGGLCGLLVAVWRPIDNVVMRVLDGLIAFPPLILALFLVAIVGGGQWQVILALTLVFFPRIARVTRGIALAVVSRPFVEASQMLGSDRTSTMLRHVLPNTVGPIAVQGTYVMARAIVIDAGLSFLGLSVPPPEPTWGNMLGDARLFIAEAWWMVLVPGLCIAITSTSVNVVGDWLRDRFDITDGDA